jgi:hypothetical protein
VREKAEHPHWSDILGRGLTAVSVATALILVLWTWTQSDLRREMVRCEAGLFAWYSSQMEVVTHRLFVSRLTFPLVLALVATSAYLRTRLRLIRTPARTAECVSWINLAHLWVLQLFLLDLLIRLMRSFSIRYGPRSGEFFPMGPLLATSMIGFPILVAVSLIRIGLRNYELPEGYRSRVLLRVGLISLSSSIAAVNMYLYSHAH